MLIREPEVNLESGLIICRSAIDRFVVEQLDAEANALIEMYDEPRDSSSKLSDGVVLSADYSLDFLDDFPATKQIGQQFMEADATGVLVTVNQQAARAFQRFHGDMKLFPVVVLHVSGEGALDTSLEPAVDVDTTEDVEIIDDDLDIQNFKTVYLSPGDVVIQMEPWKTHRGRNLGDSTRHTLALHR